MTHALHVCWPWALEWRCFGVYRSEEEADRIARTCCAECSAFCVQELPPSQPAGAPVRDAAECDGTAAALALH